MKNEETGRSRRVYGTKPIHFLYYFLFCSIFLFKKLMRKKSSEIKIKRIQKI